jgi:voltage-gated potassium channel
VLPRQILFTLLFPAFLIAFGTLGYILIEGWNWFDALYMTVTTVTTVGFSETHPLHTPGKAFTIFLMLGGVFTLFYAAGEVIRFVVSGEVRTALGKQRMEQSLAGLTNHVIVCGYGRMGKLVCKEFRANGVPFVVVEEQEEQIGEFRAGPGLLIEGDATSDEVLRRAGVDRARALVTVLGSDADNLFITMSARLLNDKLYIVARAEDERSEAKLQRAGANRVVAPYAIGGSRVANAVLRPTVVDFIELATRSEHLELQMEETQIAPGSKLAGVPLKDSQIRQELGIIIVAIKQTSGAMLFNPPPDAVMQAGDTLITLGHRRQITQLEALAGAAKR